MRFEGKNYSSIRDIGEVVVAIAQSGDKRKADEFMFEYALEIWSKQKVTFDEARRICRSNIGYLAGYYTPETMGKIFYVFDVEHPVFGRRTDVTPEEALKAGVEMGEAMKEREEG